VPRPRGGLDCGGLGRGRDYHHFEGPRRGALERGGVRSTAGEASEGSYRSVGPWAECAFGPFTLGVDLGVQAQMMAMFQRIWPECLIVLCVFWGVLVP